MKRVSSGIGMVLFSLVVVWSTFLFPACGQQQSDSPSTNERRLIVFNAGSLAAPIADLLAEFARSRPGLSPQQESSGSLEAARKITELGKPCDVLAVADYEVIPSLLMPHQADWYVIFARNDLVLIYTPKSKFSGEINSENWAEVLMRPGVQFGYSNPNLDPAGYRTLLHWQLAEKHYKKPGLYEKLKAAVPEKNIRPKSVELVALLQAGELDYVYCYKSIAEQHGMPFIKFPSEIDFSEIAKAEVYGAAEVEVDGNKPGEKLRIKGLPIRYGLTIPKEAPQKELAVEFVEFLLSEEGQAILKKRHLTSIAPALSNEPDRLPERLRRNVVPVSHQ